MMLVITNVYPQEVKMQQMLYNMTSTSNQHTALRLCGTRLLRGRLAAAPPGRLAYPRRRTGLTPQVRGQVSARRW